jgi:hypothetical protein
MKRDEIFSSRFLLYAGKVLQLGGRRLHKIAPRFSKGNPKGCLLRRTMSDNGAAEPPAYLPGTSKKQKIVKIYILYSK